MNSSQVKFSQPLKAGSCIFLVAAWAYGRAQFHSSKVESRQSLSASCPFLHLSYLDFWETDSYNLDYIREQVSCLFITSSILHRENSFFLIRQSKINPTVGTKKKYTYVPYLKYVCGTTKIYLNWSHCYSTSFIPSPYLYFVEFTTQMNKNTFLLFLFAILVFRCSSRCILSLFSFIFFSSLC